MHIEKTYIYFFIPNNPWSRLLFSRYSYTRSFLFPSMQHPYSFTRLRCCTADIVAISVMNWLFPWWDATDSCFTAITLPSLSVPYKNKKEKWHSLKERIKDVFGTTFSFRKITFRFSCICFSF